MEIITVKPRETSDNLLNPGMGWTTFHSFNGDEINQRHPQASIAYFRFYWDELEPREGEYQWDLIDELIAQGRSRGQSLAFRVMAMDGDDWVAHWRERIPKNYRVPEWFYKLGCRGKEFVDEDWGEPGTPPMWEPDYSDPIFLEKHENLIAALGERYDGHPDIDHVDLGSLGRWGEWHCGAVPIPAFEARKRIIDVYLDSFPNTPLLMLIADLEAMTYAIQRGTGWRADCLGDCRDDFFNPLWEGGTPRWNHMEDVYLQRVVEAKATKAWRKAPIAFESCWTMEHWHKQGWPIQCIFDFALALHCSILNNKSRPIPQAWWPQVNEFSRRMGYRFVLDSVEFPRVAHRGVPFSIIMQWANRGVAPCYRKDVLAFRWRNRESGAEWVSSSNGDVTGWLPGSRRVDETACLPSDFPTGVADLSVAIVDPVNRQPRIKLAIEGRDDGNWYPLNTVVVE